MRIIYTKLSPAQTSVFFTSPTNSTVRAWGLKEVMVALLLSSGKYGAEEIGELKGVFCTLSGFAGWFLHEDTNGYEASRLVYSGWSSVEEICELKLSFCKLLGFADSFLQEDANG